jgi:hypothetical protein
VPNGGGGLFWGEKTVSEPKLLPVIHGLLTTTGCGFSPRQPQPMGEAGWSVNAFYGQESVNFLINFSLRD